MYRRGRVSVKTHDLCITTTATTATATATATAAADGDVASNAALLPLPAARVTVANLSMHACTVVLNDCNGCTLQDVDGTYPSYSRTIAFRDVPLPGQVFKLETFSVFNIFLRSAVSGHPVGVLSRVPY